MQADFHYYATYCAAYLAGYSHQECMDICYSAQFVDCCSRTLLSGIKAPLSAATTQLQLEMMEARTDTAGVQDITRIWSSFHFLPRDLYADPAVHGKKKKYSRRYLEKYRLICGPNGDLLADTVNLAKGKSLQAAGIAMHVLADTWAHRYFAGTPSLVINNTNYYFYEIIDDKDGRRERPVTFGHNPGAAEDPDEGKYTGSLYQSNERSIMNLGHGRAGHLPDYSFIRYRYLPAWADYDEILKDNPSDYLHAFCQMIYALKYLRGGISEFQVDQYDAIAVSDLKYEIGYILTKRQPDASDEWRTLGERLSGHKIDDFDDGKYQKEYLDAGQDGADGTFLGKFIRATMEQKSMVTNKIYKSGNRLAGYSIDYDGKGFHGIKDFEMLIDDIEGGALDE